MVKRREISVREAVRRNNIPASTISSWMKHFKADPSFINKNNRKCEFMEINVADYLDDLAIISAKKEIEILHRTLDDEVKYEGVDVDKDLYMFLLIEDLASASCKRRNIMPFTVDQLEYEILENLRVVLLNDFDESIDDDHSDSLNDSFGDTTIVSSSDSDSVSICDFATVLTSDSYSV